MAFSSLGTDVMEQIHEYHTENPEKISAKYNSIDNTIKLRFYKRLEALKIPEEKNPLQSKTILKPRSH